MRDSDDYLGTAIKWFIILSGICLLLLMISMMTDDVRALIGIDPL